MKIQAAIFDMDGTLIDSLLLWEQIWQALGARYRDSSFVPDPVDDRAVRTMTTAAAMDYIHHRYGMGDSAEELLVLANDMIRNFYAQEVQLKAGARELLEHYRRAGVRMCVASATAADLIEVAVQHCGIRHYFERIFSCADLGVGKDVPDVYLQAQEYLGTPTEETWVFEDSLTALYTAAGIGLPTVGIYDRHNDRQDQIAAVATVYVGAEETLRKLTEL